MLWGIFWLGFGNRRNRRGSMGEGRPQPAPPRAPGVSEDLCRPDDLSGEGSFGRNRGKGAERSGCLDPQWEDVGGACLSPGWTHVPPKVWGLGTWPGEAEGSSAGPEEGPRAPSNGKPFPQV